MKRREEERREEKRKEVKRRKTRREVGSFTSFSLSKINICISPMMN